MQSKVYAYTHAHNAPKLTFREENFACGRMATWQSVFGGTPDWFTSCQPTVRQLLSPQSADGPGMGPCQTCHALRVSSSTTATWAVWIEQIS